MNNNAIDREFAWDDVIENDSTFELIPAGEYDFTVKMFERARHPGSEKLPACNKAVITLAIHTNNGDRELKHNLFLHSKTEGMLCAFFTAIGQRSHGEQLRMDWSKVTGAHGRCKIGIRNWKGKDGGDNSSNEIKQFLEPKTAPASFGGTAFTPGTF